MKKMSIRDISNELKVSTATISYILNGKAKEKRISDELAKRVLKFAKEINYKPNHLAKSLRTGKTKIICLMIESISDYFFSAVAGHIEDIAYQKGYKIIYCSTKNDTSKTKELIQTFKNRNVDGYIITPAVGIEKDVTSLIAEKIPVILFDRYLEGVKSSYVGMDNLHSSYRAVNHLFENGYNNVALITLDSDQIQMKDRASGYEKAIAENGKTSIVKKIPYSIPVADNVVDDIISFLKNNPTVDAIFFATNYLGISGLEALNKLELNISEDIGIVVFDDNDLFRVHKPTISAVSQPIHQMSLEIINLLLAHLENTENYVPQRIIVPATLSVRQSSLRKS